MSIHHIQLTQEELAHVERNRDPHFAQRASVPKIYTPDRLAADVAAAANLRSMAGSLMLEPSCGRGALITAALELQPDLGIIAYDLDADEVEHVANSTAGADVVVRCRDFLQISPRRKVDVVLMHPPAFADIEHVSHALTFLRPGGKLVAIMSADWQDSPRASELLAELGALMHSVSPIRAGTFKASGSKVAMAMLVVRMGRS